MAPPPALLFSDSKASGWFFMAERAQESFVYEIEPKKRNRTVWMEWRHGRTRNGVAATVCHGLMFCRTKIFGLVVPPRIRRALANILVHARYGRRCAGPRGAPQAAESKRQPRACRAPQDRKTHGSISNLILSRLSPSVCISMASVTCTGLQQNATSECQSPIPACPSLLLLLLLHQSLGREC